MLRGFPPLFFWWVMIDIDVNDMKKLTENLKHIHKEAYPKTLWYTLNSMAKEAAIQGKENIQKSFTLRNKYIQGSVGYNSKKTFDINSMEACAGQFAVYKGKPTGQLEKQEFGKSVLAKGKYTFAATPSARGGSYNKVIRRNNQFNNLNIKKLSDIVKNPTKDNSKQVSQAQAFAIRNNKNLKILLTTRKGSKGIFTVSHKSVSLLYNLRNKKTNIKQTQWLKPASDKVVSQAGRIYMIEARKRLEREISKGLTMS